MVKTLGFQCTGSTLDWETKIAQKIENKKAKQNYTHTKKQELKDPK